MILLALIGSDYSFILTYLTWPSLHNSSVYSFTEVVHTKIVLFKHLRQVQERSKGWSVMSIYLLLLLLSELAALLLFVHASWQAVEGSQHKRIEFSWSCSSLFLKIRHIQKGLSLKRPKAKNKLLSTIFTRHCKPLYCM